MDGLFGTNYFALVATPGPSIYDVINSTSSHQVFHQNNNICICVDVLKKLLLKSMWQIKHIYADSN